ncbi:trypsin-like peptidase domain-containing protein [Sphingomonas mollis]|uniref:Serine protease n=1 Tax=Sphingomonas mollis TaxID=2795726 RepID=A0ABS0XQ48_9SPHN|nr:trypsin-like peptidase domain-containing protein [Sphingomonas sp. BT553]
MTLGWGDDAGAALVSAILSAYDKPRLSSLLRFKGGLILENEVNTDAPFRRVVENLTVLLDQQGDTERFLALAFADRPGNPRLQTLAAAHGLTATTTERTETMPPPATAAEYVAAAQAALPADPAVAALAGKLDGPAPAPHASLEALVARRSKLIDFGRFLTGLEKLMPRICRISVPGSAGTGFLVGTDLVLTNYHVVEGLIRDDYTFDQVECEFDFNSDVARTQRIGITAKPGHFSPYSASDMSGAGEPAPNELDYALLHLAQPIGGGDRGFYPLDATPRLLSVGDFMFVSQHAAGQLLSLAMGTITDFPGKALRLRYDVTTGPGSSGSPCFSSELDLIGLHHAAQATIAPTYNQAVPIWMVARHIAAAGNAP